MEANGTSDVHTNIRKIFLNLVCRQDVMGDARKDVCSIQNILFPYHIGLVKGVKSKTQLISPTINRNVIIHRCGYLKINI